MPEMKNGINKKKIIKYTAVAAACIAGVAVLSMSMNRTASANAKPAEEKIFKVKTTTVEPTGSGVFLEYTGLVQPAELMQVTFSTLGTISEIYVEEGDSVTKGQLLAKLDAEDAKRQQTNMQELAGQTDTAVANAQAARDQAQKDYDAACKTASQSDLDAAREKRDTAQANRDAKQTELDGFNQQAEKDKKLVETAQAEYDEAYAPLEQAQAELEKAQEEEKTALDKKEKAFAEKEKLNASDSGATEQEKEAANAAYDTANTEYTEAQQKTATAKSNRDAKATAPELAAARTKLTEAQTQLARSQSVAGTAQTQLTALDTELNARQTAYDTLANQGPNSAEAKARKRALDSAENTLSIAKSAQITAKNSYQTAQSDVIDCDLKAPADGYVVKVVGNVGGMAAPIAPTVVLGSTRATVQFGVSQNDVRKIEEGGSAQITVGEREFQGTVTSIATTPDTTTRTYMVNVDIVANTEEFYIGEMAQVKIEAGQRTGAWMPLTCVLNDGEDYVYIVENGRAVRRVVTIEDVNDDKLLLNGLDTGSLVITEGMKTVRSGSAVATD